MLMKTEQRTFCGELIFQLLSGKGLKGIANFLASYTQRSVVITSLTNHVLAANTFPPFPLTGVAVTITASQPDEKIWNVEYDSFQLLAYRFEIAFNNRCVGSLYLSVEASEELREDMQVAGAMLDIPLLGRNVALLCALEYQRQEQLQEVERQYKNVFIYDLLYGNQKSDEEIVAKGKLWGWDLTTPHAVVVMELADYQNVAPDNQQVSQLRNTAEILLGEFGFSPIVMQKKSEVILILPIQGTKKREKKEAIARIIQVLQKRMTTFLGKRLIWIGIGRDFSRPSELFRSYQEAKVARELGEIMMLPDQVAYFVDLGFSRLLYGHDLQELKEFYFETLGELISYDQEQKTEMMATLYAYLHSGGDMTKTADSLFLHRNTLRYRLNRIEEILDLSLDDVETRLNLLTAFRIGNLKGFARSEGG